MLIESFTSRLLVFHLAACLSLVQSQFRTCFHPLPSLNSAARSMKLSFAMKCGMLLLPRQKTGKRHHLSDKKKGKDETFFIFTCCWRTEGEGKVEVTVS